MIIVDTGAFYALIDKNDMHHSDAKNFYNKIIQKDTLCTSLPILTETWLLLEARLGANIADKFWMTTTKGIFPILELSIDDLAIALASNNKYKQAGFGFVDATTFALCEKHKTPDIFTYDRKHFQIYKPSFAKSLNLFPSI